MPGVNIKNWKIFCLIEVVLFYLQVLLGVASPSETSTALRPSWTTCSGRFASLTTWRGTTLYFQTTASSNYSEYSVCSEKWWKTTKDRCIFNPFCKGAEWILDFLNHLGSTAHYTLQLVPDYYWNVTVQLCIGNVNNSFGQSLKI